MATFTVTPADTDGLTDLSLPSNGFSSFADWVVNGPQTDTSFVISPPDDLDAAAIWSGIGLGDYVGAWPTIGTITGLQVQNGATGQVEEILSGLSVAASDLNTWITTGDDAAAFNAFFGGADTITGGPVGEHLLGFGGDDVLIGGAGADILDGGAGSDTASYASAGGAITASLANPASNTGHAAGDTYISIENLTGSSFADTLSGDDNANILDGNGGVDTLAGLGGDDVLAVTGATGQIVTIGSVDGGSGVDTLRLNAGSGSQNLIAWTIASIERLSVAGSSATYQFNADAGLSSTLNLDASGAASHQANVVISRFFGLAGTVDVSAWTFSNWAGVLFLDGNNSGADILIGSSQTDNIHGFGGNDLLSGGAGADALDGGAGIDTASYASSLLAVSVNLATGLGVGGDAQGDTLANIENILGSAFGDTLAGDGLGNLLNGGAGGDAMFGGLGDDAYVVDNGGDTVTENVGEGADTIQSSITYTLTANVENLLLTGAGAINGTGNGLNNNLTGNGAVNVLDGGAGADVLDGAGGGDTMIGGFGNDTYIVDNAGDVVSELSSQGTDTVQASVSYTLTADVENLTLIGVAAINGTGNALNNIITGNSAINTLTGGVGNDTLFGGAGADTLLGGDGNDTLSGQAGADTAIGGLGDDTYVVESAGDVVSEAPGEGTDTVNAFISYALPVNIENLLLLSTITDGTGNALNNTITGNAANNTLFGLNGADTLYGLNGNDTLYGGAGVDVMIGGTGNDAYYVESAGDVITELSGEGADIVNAWVSFVLPANIENLTLLGIITDGTGNALDNIITGNGANNNLFGLAGADTLYGLAGNDALYGGAGGDTMIGGLGDDAYNVDNAADVVVENASEGADTINTFISGLTLAANVENLTLLGSVAAGTGNDLANIITGNAAANTLDGGAGADTLIGAAGNDAFVFHAGQADGDAIADFDGQGASAGDSLSFSGYGAAADGANVVQLDATHWQINSADGAIHDIITLANGASLDQNDFIFGP